MSPGATAKASGRLTATVATAAPATASPTTGTAAAQIDTSSADQYITRLPGQNDAQYAIVQANGTILAQHEDTTPVAAGQAVDAMLLLAYLRAHSSSDPTGAAAAHLQAMIENSSATAARLGSTSQVGAGAVQQIASLAHMSGFHLDSAPGIHALVRSTVTAADLALLLANIDTLMPAPVRTYGMGLLDHIPHANQWGLLSAGISVSTRALAAASPEPTANGRSPRPRRSAPASTAPSRSLSPPPRTLAVKRSERHRKRRLDLLATASTDTSGYSIDTSGLSPSQQAELSNLAQNMQNSGQSSQCPNVSVSGSLPTVPGQLATIDAATGVAAAPTGLPSAVGHGDRQADRRRQPDPHLPLHRDPYPSMATMWPGYDCSGSTSYILYKAGLLGSAPYVSGMFDKWGQPGPGKYVTVFYNAAHVFIEVDGIVFDTAHYAPTEPAGTGPRWRPSSMIQAQIDGDVADGNGGFAEAHPPGL